MSNVTDCNVSGNKFIQDAAGIQLEFGADANVIANKRARSLKTKLELSRAASVFSAEERGRRSH